MNTMSKTVSKGQKGFGDLAANRRSVRKYKKEPMPRAIILRLIDAGRWAPSGLNTQPWRFIVIDDPGKKAWIRQAYDKARARGGLYQQDSSFMEDGALVLVCADGSKQTSEISCAMACQNMLLAAADLGLGGVMMTCLMDEAGRGETTRFMGVKEPYKPFALLAFGFCDEKPKAKPRKKLDELVSYNRF